MNEFALAVYHLPILSQTLMTLFVTGSTFECTFNRNLGTFDWLLIECTDSVVKVYYWCTIQCGLLPRVE